MTFKIFTQTVMALALAASLFGGSAKAASPAETFVSENIERGMAILNNTQLSTAQRRDQFQTFLLSVTDMKRLATSTLGQYASTTSPADQSAYAAAFQDYAVAVYQSYFAAYSGQGLKVTASSERAPGDFIVTSVVTDASGKPGQQQVLFRVRTDLAKPQLVDVNVAGVWLAVGQRDQFSAFLGQKPNTVQALIAHVREATTRYR